MTKLAVCRSCIDEPNPLFATNGGIRLRGWCFDESSPLALQVRLVIAGRFYPCTSGLLRPDVGGAFPQFSQAMDSGFSFQGWVPLGYNAVHFEVSKDGSDWRRVKSLPLCAELAPLIVHVDTPASLAATTSVTLSGWAFHPQEPIEALFMRVGGSTALSSYGTPTADVGADFPNVPQSDRAGFQCHVKAPLHSSPIMFKARLRSGLIVVGRPEQRIELEETANDFVQTLDEHRASLLVFPESNSPKVSIIIPVFGQTQLTLACLKSILKNTEGISYEVAVVDDHSSEDTARCLQRIKGLRVLTNRTNIGFLHSCNKGAAAARGEYLVFLNNDTETTPGWLSAMLRVLEQRHDAGLVGAKLIYPDGRLQEAGGIIWRDASGANYGKGDDADKPQYNYLREVDYCSGACILIRKALFLQVGAFDPTFAPAYYEDTDLAFKVRQAGLTVYYQPLATVIHHEGHTSGTCTESGVKSYQVVNQTKFQSKWQNELNRHATNGDLPLDRAKDRGISRRVLVVDARTLSPDQDSGSMRMLNLIGVFQQLGFKVTFLPLNRLRVAAYTDRMKEAGIECLYDPFVVNLETLLRTRSDEFDLILLSRAGVAESLLDICRANLPGTPVIFDTVDLHFLRQRREADITQVEETRACASQSELMERKLASRCDAVIVVSPVEKRILEEKLPHQRIKVVSNIHEARADIAPFEVRQDFLFIGGFEHTPNVDAMVWFCAEIMPLISKELPDAKLHIIGSKMPDAVRALASNQVLVRGYVENIDPFFESCLLSVAPLRFGAGVKGKINQSMSFGLPVVSTMIGVEGMHLTHGEDVLVAEMPARFAAAVVRLHRDRNLWNCLSNNGLKNVEEHFSIVAAKRNLEELLIDLRVLPAAVSNKSAIGTQGGHRS